MTVKARTEIDGGAAQSVTSEAKREPATTSGALLKAVGTRDLLQEFLRAFLEGARSIPVKTPEGLYVMSEDLEYETAIKRLYDFVTNGGNHPCCSVTEIGPDATRPTRIVLELPKRRVQTETGAERMQGIITIEGRASEPVHFRVEFKYQRPDSMPHIANAIGTLRRHHIL
jgi:hypothetical protein